MNKPQQTSMWEGVGHFLMMEKPKLFNEAVMFFSTRMLF
jgi:pimeloyl-ACP methyl ester carboxylesterase